MQYTKDLFINKSLHKHGDKYNYSYVNYINSKIKVIIVCPAHGEFSQTPSEHLSGAGCYYCGRVNSGNKLRLSRLDIIFKCESKHNNKYKYGEIINGKIDVICLEHGLFCQTISRHISGQGCPKCGKSEKLTNEEFIQRGVNLHNNKYSYESCIYINNYTKVNITCSKHGIFRVTPHNHINGKCGCPVCNLSKSELKIKKYLDNNNIEYHHQYKFPECKNKRPLPFDFYLPKYNMCIEYDGIMHYEVTSLKNDLNNQILKDTIKTNYCNNNKINLLRISCFEKYKIEEILERKLNEKTIY